MLASLASLEPLASLALCAPLRYTAHIRTLNRAIRVGTRYARFRIVCLVLALPTLAPFGARGLCFCCYGHVAITIDITPIRCKTCAVGMEAREGLFGKTCLIDRFNCFVLRKKAREDSIIIPKPLSTLQSKFILYNGGGDLLFRIITFVELT